MPEVLLDMGFSIQSSSKVEVPIGFSILDSHVVTKDLGFRLSKGYSVDKGLGFTINSSHVITKLLDFRFRSPKIVTKQSDITLCVKPQLDTLTYEDHIDAVNDVEAIHNVSVLYKTDELPYTVKNTTGNVIIEYSDGYIQTVPAHRQLTDYLFPLSPAWGRYPGWPATTLTWVVTGGSPWYGPDTVRFFPDSITGYVGYLIYYWTYVTCAGQDWTDCKQFTFTIASSIRVKVMIGEVVVYMSAQHGNGYVMEDIVIDTTEITGIHDFVIAFQQETAGGGNTWSISTMRMDVDVVNFVRSGLIHSTAPVTFDITAENAAGSTITGSDAIGINFTIPITSTLRSTVLPYIKNIFIGITEMGKFILVGGVSEDGVSAPCADVMDGTGKIIIKTPTTFSPSGMIAKVIQLYTFVHNRVRMK